MSSPKAAAKTARRTAGNGKPKVAAAKVAPAKPKLVPQNELSNDAVRLAEEIERQFAKTDDVLSVDAMQTLMGALCRVYSAQIENGKRYTPIAEGQAVSPTGIMQTASGLLRAGNLAVFELGMWQSWTGR
jgi:hypothetical protein